MQEQTYFDIQRRTINYLREIEPFINQLVRLEMSQQVSITLSADRKTLLKYELRWTPESKVLADKLRETVAYIRQRHFTDLELICGSQTPRQDNSPQAQDTQANLQPLPSVAGNEGRQEIPPTH